VRLPRFSVVDFETHGIQGRPDYPPKPVGVAIKRPGRKSRYYAFGHASENNCTEDVVRSALADVWESGDDILMHNAKFDLDVAETHWGLRLPRWDRVHDTTFLLFLDDPNQREVGLKPAAARLLRMPPGERDAVKDWLLEHQPVAGVRIGKGDHGKHPWGAFIAYAPGKLVGAYACGDVDRTEGLYRLLLPSIVKRGMLEAYNRERRLSQILLAMERQGVRVDVQALRRDIKVYRAAQAQADAMILDLLGIMPGTEFNVGSGDQIVAALTDAGMLDMTKVTWTDGGKSGNKKVSTAKGALDDAVSDRRVSALLRYRSALNTCLSTFMEPWLEVAARTGGLIYTSWNQIKGESGMGTRTGRLSSSPNFQNIPKEFTDLFKDIKDAAIKALPSLPMCRAYVLPYAPGHVLVGRDFSQQEVRILAHFEDGPLLEQYLKEPWTDMHDFARGHLETVFSRPFTRGPVKAVGLGLIYGQGVGSLAKRNGWTVTDTQKVSDAILALYPGLRTMREDMKNYSRIGTPLRTWGGRLCLCEPPRIVDGEFKTYAYKMVNTLIQGSAADDTKEAMIAYVTRLLGGEAAWDNEVASQLLHHPWKLLLQVHDELLTSVPRKDLVPGHAMLREAMESVPFDLPILTEGVWSDRDWGSMEKYDVKGRVVATVPKVRTKRAA
jgi:DNA polymerase I